MIKLFPPNFSLNLIALVTLIAFAHCQAASVCDPGYYFNPSTDFCQQGIANCQTFIAATGKCQVCNLGYVLASNACI